MADRTAAADSPGFLSPYRILDLTQDIGLMASRPMALLGSEVLQIEPPAGSEFRSSPPVLAQPGGPFSLTWAVFGAGRKSVTIYLQTEAGRQLFLALVRTADFLIEDRARGSLERLGLGHDVLIEANPALIHVTISAFGVTGPKRDYAHTELVVWSASGVPYQNGNAQLAPLRISVPQAYLHAAADAAIGALIAHFARLQDGKGQHVQVSALRSSAAAALSAHLAAFVEHPWFRLMDSFIPASKPNAPDLPGAKKRVDLSGSGAASGRTSWRALDGDVQLHLAMGPATGHFTNTLFAWIAECGEGGAGCDWDWRRLHEDVLSSVVRDEDIELARQTVERFLGRRNRYELAEASVARRLLIAPCFGIEELASLPHFAARDVFHDLQGANGATYRAPGAFAHISGKAFVPAERAPELGEHTDRIFAELGFSETELNALHMQGVI